SRIVVQYYGRNLPPFGLRLILAPSTGPHLQGELKELLLAEWPRKVTAEVELARSTKGEADGGRQVDRLANRVQSTGFRINLENDDIVGTFVGHKQIPTSGIDRKRPRRSSARLKVCYHVRSEEHTSELQSPCNLVCRLL